MSNLLAQIQSPEELLDQGILAPFDWADAATRMMKDLRCRAIYGYSRSVKTSHYMPAQVFLIERFPHPPLILSSYPTVYVGCVGSPREVATALLHEAGHHEDGFVHGFENGLSAECRAWNVAEKLARKYKLPFLHWMREECLDTYRKYYGQEG